MAAPGSKNRLRRTVPAPGGINHQQNKQRDTGTQKPPGKGGAQRHDGKGGKNSDDAPPLYRHGVYKAGQNPEQNSPQRGEKQHTPRRHGRQTVHPGKIPQPRRQEQILHRHRQQPRGKKLADQVRRLKAAQLFLQYHSTDSLFSSALFASSVAFRFT